MNDFTCIVCNVCNNYCIHATACHTISMMGNCSNLNVEKILNNRLIVEINI